MHRRRFLQTFSSFIFSGLLLKFLAACGEDLNESAIGEADANPATLPKNQDTITDSDQDPIKDDQVLQDPNVEYVEVYDTYAMALYFDGSLGPKTGIIKTQYIIDNQSITLDFWHGHGGSVHRFELTKEHFLQLKKGNKITVSTTSVDNHTHKLFIDPTDTRYRVPGALAVKVRV